jgi:hypothetical protein
MASVTKTYPIVSAGDDNGIWTESQTVKTGGTTLRLGTNYSSTDSTLNDYYFIFLRFPYLDIPPGVTITSATLHLYKYTTLGNGSAVPLQTNIKYPLSQAVSPVQTWDDYVNATWAGSGTDIPFVTTTGSGWHDYDVTTDIQFAVTEPEWYYGCPIEISIGPNIGYTPTYKYTMYYAYEYGSYAPYLTVTYEDPVSNVFVTAVTAKSIETMKAPSVTAIAPVSISVPLTKAAGEIKVPAVSADAVQAVPMVAANGIPIVPNLTINGVSLIVPPPVVIKCIALNTGIIAGWDRIEISAQAAIARIIIPVPEVNAVIHQSAVWHDYYITIEF